MPTRIAALLMLVLPAATAQTRREIQVPDLPGLRTLVCDFHMHTVFSDGTVWPTVRIDEAWRTGLDAIALSDHLEYQPHAADLPTNHHRPFQLCEQRAKEHGLILIRAAELTRATPPGHFNALFVNDFKPLETRDLFESIRQANQQRAFVFWNHHDWQGPEAGEWLDIHQQLFDGKLLHGMEVANGGRYFPRAHRWCLDKNLTMLGNSDIHPPDLRAESTSSDHRTCTLVFASGEGAESIRQALAAGRTAVWFGDRVIGRREWLAPLFDACVEVDKPHLRAGNDVWVRVRNRSPFDLKLTRTAGPGPERIELAAKTVSLMKVRLPGDDAATEFAYTVDNFLIGPGIGLPVVHRHPQAD
jgi:3',5'-nucleoside bisphosphate phosphatase